MCLGVNRLEQEKPMSASQRERTDTAFDRDTSVRRRKPAAGSSPAPIEATFDADVSADWLAVNGPHGGYLAALMLSGITEAVGNPARSPRTLTIHYIRPGTPGSVSIHTVLERTGRSLSSISARMEQNGSLIALAFAAFSGPWQGPEIADSPMMEVAPSDPTRVRERLLDIPPPPFVERLVIQPRLGGVPFSGSDAPMEVGAWLGLVEPRPVDTLALAFFSDALLATVYPL
jgi:acyl-CoA thioesterase